MTRSISGEDGQFLSTRRSFHPLPRLWLPSTAGPLDSRSRRAWRLRDGDEFLFICDDGGEYLARLTATGIEVLQSRRLDVELPYRITLYLAALKGEQMRYVIEQATELGLSDLVPLETERSVVRLPFRDIRWQQAAREAAARCGRVVAPRVHPGVRWAEAVTTGHGFLAVERRPHLPMLQSQAGDVALFVGPEAGLTDGEVAQAEASGIQPVTLGPRMLRAMTAAMAGVAVLAIRPPDP